MMNEESKNNDFEVLKRLTVYGQAGLLGNIEVLRVDNDASRPEVFLFEDTRFPDCGNAPEWRAAFVNELHSCFGAGVETVWMCASRK